MPGQEAKVISSNADNLDLFGVDVAIDGNTMVVGAPQEDSAATGVNGDETDNSADRSGAAYVFEWDGSNWDQQAYLKASNAEALDLFGSSVDISGDIIVVGAPRESSAANEVDGNQADNSAFRAGAAYVFVKEGDAWIQEAYLKAHNAQSEDFFGVAVAIHEDVIVVGADGEDGSQNQSSRSGAAYVFRHTDATWVQQASLRAFNASANDAFGLAVAIDGETIAIGATGEDSGAVGVDGDETDNSRPNSGAAYVFRYTGADWVHDAYLKASNTAGGDAFGVDVAIHEGTIAIGASGEDSSAVGIGGEETDDASPDSGAVYVFRRDGTSWSQEAYIKASNSESEDRFGNSVALHKGTLLVGATGEDSRALGINGDQADNAFSDSGAAYLFVRPDAAWSQLSYIKSLSTSSNDRFGTTAAIFDDIAVVSEPLADLGFGRDNAGAAYAYRVLRPYVTDLSIQPADPLPGDLVTFFATAHLPAELMTSLTSAESRLNDDPWQPMRAVDNNFDGETERIFTPSFDGASVSQGTHEICARAYDDQGNVSIPACLIIGEICDNGIDDDGDGLVDAEDEDCPGMDRVGLLVACLHDPIYPTTLGDTVDITARVMDGDGIPFTAEEIEIWFRAPDTIATAPALVVQNADTATFSISPNLGSFDYACLASRSLGGGSAAPEADFSGWRKVDVGTSEAPDFPAIMALLNPGGPSRNIDIVFFPDEDNYPGGHLDPSFHQDVYDLIFEGLYTIPWFVTFQHFFNFHLGRTTALTGPDPSSDRDLCIRKKPDLSPFQEFGSLQGYKAVFAFADAGGIVHRKDCRDNAGSPDIFTLSMHPERLNPDQLNVIAHEMGHRPFGLKDEYCCDGGYSSNKPFPNLFKTEAKCRNGASDRGFDPDECRELFARGRNWWLFEPDFEKPGRDTSEIKDVMQGTGWGPCRFDPNETCATYRVGISEIDRLNWMLGKCVDEKC